MWGLIKKGIDINGIHLVDEDITYCIWGNNRYMSCRKRLSQGSLLVISLRDHDGDTVGDEMNYADFLKSKEYKIQPVGFEIDNSKIHYKLFPFQKDIVRWAVKKGRCAVFLDTGLGKTFIQLEWARIIDKTTLIFAPLSVARQTVQEGKKIDVEVKYVRSKEDIKGKGIYITNYELIDYFDESQIEAIVLDESSILKSLSGKIKQKLIKKFGNIQYKICCTATPAPNDYIELGNHAEFLNICTMQEMLAMFFINANKEYTYIVGDKIITKKGSNKNGQEWRLKHHAEDIFFRWLSKWAILMSKPSDLGYDDNGFILPQLDIESIFIPVDYYNSHDKLFFIGLSGIEDRIKVRKETIRYKIEKLKELINFEDQTIIWCGLDEESRMIKNCLGDDAVEVRGSDALEDKIKALEDFQDSKYKVLITKPKIAGFGMNFQNANRMVFFGLNDSWETFYQAIRREWRFGQTKPVHVYVLLTELERDIFENIKRKDMQARRLKLKMIDLLKDYEKNEIQGLVFEIDQYREETIKTDNYTMMLGDSCERIKEIKDETVDLSIYSPPFVDLFVYSNSYRDLGNCRNWDEFFQHYDFIVKEILRITKPGRLSCVHTSDIPALANKDGYIGLKDFPGSVIDLHEKNGWIFFGRIFIQKNPQAQAIRVKSKALLFVQMQKDSSHSRPALIDQVLLFKKPGENKIPIAPVKNGELDNEKWIQWAHGIWTDIRETDTLQYYNARAPEDEKHICPLQLETISRLIKLYSNPGEIVFSPFAGIGSEIFMAVKLGRIGIGIELKRSYFEMALKYLKALQHEKDSLLISNCLLPPTRSQNNGGYCLNVEPCTTTG